ncbi:MAG: alpha-L-fucosidase, partial [Chitinophagaceae bacterium]
KNTWQITRNLQPMANIFSDVGLDVRWVGNEDGFAADTSWATFTPAPPEGKNVAVPGQANYPQSPAGIKNGDFWMPAECDVPLRQGWFFHANEKPKTPDKLFDLYLKSVGRGAGLDLGLAPNTKGILNEDDVSSLQTFGSILKNTFSVNLLKGAKILATTTRGKSYAVNNLIDGNTQTYWATADDTTDATITFELNKATTFDIISLQEFIALGQRIDSFSIEISNGNNWKKVYAGASIGAKRLVKLENVVTAQKIRIKLKAPVALTLSEVGIYKYAG